MLTAKEAANVTRKSLKETGKEIAKARNIYKTLGLKAAAKYLKNRNWSVEAAVHILLAV